MACNTEKSKSGTHTTLDCILVQLGDFGKYQIFVFGLISIAVILHSMAHISFVFTAQEIEHRCKIPECDNSLPNNESEFKPDWLKYAVPFTDDKPEKCTRFQPYNASAIGQCGIDNFNADSPTGCDNGYVYASSEITILQAFDLQCMENTWKLKMVGTVNNIGQFIGLPLGGLFSDHFGRKATLVWGLVLCGVCGVIRAFSTSYTMFLIFEFLDAAFGASTYACGFIIGVELVGPSKRVLTGTIISSCYAVGEVVVALLAWWLQSWKYLILAAYAPSLLLISYLWITPESVRWLLSQSRYEEAKDILRSAAKINNKKISEDALEKLEISEESAPKESLRNLFKSNLLLWRFVNCCICWMTCTFLFYGLTLNSVSLVAGNSYIDFILTSLVEIPAYVITCLIVDRLGRRISQCGSYLLTGICCLTFIFIEGTGYYAQLTLYLLGKFGATVAFTIIYIITSEIFPTPLRHSMMATCSMVGRIGSMVSPQTPLLEHIWKPLPLVLFGALSIIAGCLSLLFPETLKTKLPDTIEEAKNIGKQRMEEK